MQVGTPQLVARDLFQSFRMGARRIEVLCGISMEIACNEAVFLSGASGAGKTTLLYTLAGLERPESGTVEFEGRSLYSETSTTQARLRNEKMGFVFQGYFLLPELTGNLDSKTGDAIIDLLLNLARQRNKTLLVVTHDARLAARGDRQLHIKDGVLQ
jgi:ABC-type lipoprotein export system ATPase subunit